MTGPDLDFLEADARAPVLHEIVQEPDPGEWHFHLIRTFRVQGLGFRV